MSAGRSEVSPIAVPDCATALPPKVKARAIAAVDVIKAFIVRTSSSVGFFPAERITTERGIEQNAARMQRFLAFEAVWKKRIVGQLTSGTQP
jgi:hypothetical protein